MFKYPAWKGSPHENSIAKDIPRAWFVMTALALTGQIAWAVENSWFKKYDPTRLVDHASGWFDQGGGDFQNRHIYVRKLFRPKPDKRAFVLSEFGGYSQIIPGHLWDENKKFGYRFYDSGESLTRAYLALLKNELKPLIARGLTAAIYTQTSDVEIEINGYVTYDRKVEKMDAETLRSAHLALYDDPEQLE